MRLAWLGAQCKVPNARSSVHVTIAKRASPSPTSLGLSPLLFRIWGAAERAAVLDRPGESLLFCLAIHRGLFDSWILLQAYTYTLTDSIQSLGIRKLLFRRLMKANDLPRIRDGDNEGALHAPPRYRSSVILFILASFEQLYPHSTIEKSWI